MGEYSSETEPQRGNLLQPIFVQGAKLERFFNKIKQWTRKQNFRRVMRATIGKELAALYEVPQGL